MPNSNYWTLELEKIEKRYPNQTEFSTRKNISTNTVSNTAIFDTGTYLLYAPYNYL